MPLFWKSCIGAPRLNHPHSPLVLALNPSIDVEWRVSGLHPDEKNVIQSERRWAGGKGINVARWLKHLGHRPALLLPLGAETGDELGRFLRSESIPYTAVPIREPTRCNFIVSPPTGPQLRFNPPGPKLSQAAWTLLSRSARRALPRSACAIFSGSLPRAAPLSTYARFVRLAHELGTKVLLDCDGPALNQALRTRPFLVKPNRAELAQCLARPLPRLTDVHAAATRLSEMTGGWVLASLGPAGALLAHAAHGVSWFAKAPQVSVRNTVGAGDALLAAAARQIILGEPPEQWLRWGIATGTACAECPPGLLPSAARIQSLAVGVDVRRL